MKGVDLMEKAFENFEWKNYPNKNTADWMKYT